MTDRDIGWALLDARGVGQDELTYLYTGKVMTLMKYFGSGLLAIALLLQGCNEEDNASAKNDTSSAPNPIKKFDIANNKNTKTPLSRADAVSFFRALEETSYGQKERKGRCGNLGTELKGKKNLDRRLDVTLPFEACEFEGLILNGRVQIVATNDGKTPATSVGDVTVEGGITGLCAIILQYPNKYVFDIVKTADPNTVDIETLITPELTGKLCNYDIQELAKEAAAEKAAEKKAKAEAAKLAKAAKAAEKKAKAEAKGAKTAETTAEAPKPEAAPTPEAEKAPEAEKTSAPAAASEAEKAPAPAPTDQSATAPDAAQ